MDKELNWLKQLSETAGVSGFEGPIKALLKKRLQTVADVSYDQLGSILFTKAGADHHPRIMLASHMDEIGFLVKHITKEGFLKFTTLGGWWEQVMLGQRVTVHSHKGLFPGVIGSKPPHILSPEERKKVVEKKDMYIDIGAADEAEVKERFGICPGDVVTPYAPFTVMGNDRFLLGKAWDNRIGCAVMVRVLEELALEEHPNTVIGAATVQEEVGLRGAQTSVKLASPDIAFVIDTCVAGDTPGVTPDIAAGKLGAGVAITFFDASMIPHTALRDFVIETAKKENIPYQLSFSEGGGTDGGRIHMYEAGVPTLVISLPTRYIHSHQSMIHRDDYEAAVRLMRAVLRKLNKEALEALLAR